MLSIHQNLGLVNEMDHCSYVILHPVSYNVQTSTQCACNKYTCMLAANAYTIAAIVSSVAAVATTAVYEFQVLCTHACKLTTALRYFGKHYCAAYSIVYYAVL